MFSPEPGGLLCARPEQGGTVVACLRFMWVYACVYGHVCWEIWYACLSGKFRFGPDFAVVKSLDSSQEAVQKAGKEILRL